MKIRKGFVSNSSSSSFVIKKENLSPKQIDKIYRHWQDENFCKGEDWVIQDMGDYILGNTSMDNFDMKEYLSKIGVANEHIEWDSGHW